MGTQRALRVETSYWGLVARIEGSRVVDETEPEVESDLRRRAAWLLGMLAVVAVLFVVVMTVLIGNDKPNSDNADPGPLDGAVTSHASSTTATKPRTSAAARTSTASSASSTSSGAASCPTSQRCALDDDIGNAVAAVNAYRTQHGKPAVPGTVSAAAKECALRNGNGCSGGWAETQLSAPDGQAAVKNILPFAKLLSPMQSFGVGWAYDPASKEYFFSIVRND
jgi:hypothetical protein